MAFSSPSTVMLDPSADDLDFDVLAVTINAKSDVPTCFLLKREEVFALTEKDPNGPKYRLVPPQYRQKKFEDRWDEVNAWPVGFSKQITPDFEADLQHLVASVKALMREVDMATTFYAAWRPLVDDKELEQRFGRSYATRTLNDINKALKREMLLSLCRLWDRKRDGGISLTWVLDRLTNKEFKSYMIEKIYFNMPKEFFNSTCEDFCSAFSVENDINDCIRILRLYMRGGENHKILESARGIRNKFLAHHQVIEPETPIVQHGQEDFEKFYNDMVFISNILMSVVCRTLYDPLDLQRQLAKCASHFWKNAQSEQFLKG